MEFKGRLNSVYARSRRGSRDLIETAVRDGGHVHFHEQPAGKEFACADSDYGLIDILTVPAVVGS